MRKSRFTDEQIVAILRDADRTSVAEAAKKSKVSEQTLVHAAARTVDERWPCVRVHGPHLQDDGPVFQRVLRCDVGQNNTCRLRHAYFHRLQHGDV